MSSAPVGDRKGIQSQNPNQLPFSTFPPLLSCHCHLLCQGACVSWTWWDDVKCFDQSWENARGPEQMEMESKWANGLSRFSWRMVLCTRTVLCRIMYHSCIQSCTVIWAVLIGELGPVSLGSFCVYFCVFLWGHLVCYIISFFVFLCIIWLLFGCLERLVSEMTCTIMCRVGQTLNSTHWLWTAVCDL